MDSMPMTDEKRKWVSEAGPRQTKLVNKAISELGREHNTGVTLSGIVGGEDRRYSYWSPFGGGARADVTAAQTRIAEEFNYTITAKNYKAIIAAFEAALPALREARPVNDERRTPEEVTEQEQASKDREAKRCAEDQAKSLQRDAVVRELRLKYPWAKAPSSLSEYARAAANLRQELALEFPGVKFSVTSSSASMTNSVRYEWTLGPCAVSKIADKYEYGGFDAMQDLQTIDHSAYGEAVGIVLGRAKYVRGSRHIPEEIHERVGRLLCEAQQVDYEDCEAGRVHLHGDGDSRWLSDHVNRLIDRTTFPQGSEITGVEYSNGGYDENTGEDKESGYYLTFSEPTCSYPANDCNASHDPGQHWPTPIVSPSGVTVSENEAKGGIEIRFPAKPSSDVLSTLKANGWRWSRFSKCWYHKASDRAREFASRLVA